MTLVTDLDDLDDLEVLAGFEAEDDRAESVGRRLPLAPEDLAGFDPADDRADYIGRCESVDPVDVARIFYGRFWPESVGV